MAVKLDPIAVALRSAWYQKRTLPPELNDSHLVSSAIQSIRERWPDCRIEEADKERPIFIFSAGWGSGSTLLQRLVVSSDECLVWGEPFDHAAPIQRLAKTIAPISTSWPRPVSFEFQDEGTKLADRWIANLTPGIENLRAAHQQYFLHWLKTPATQAGYLLWGLKEVRLTIDHAQYLRWLFPRARFLFLVRDIMNSYRSCKKVNWYSIWPDYRVRDVTYFAHHWRMLTSQFLSNYQDVDGMLVKYEDLVAGLVDIEDIEKHIGIGPLDVSVLEKKIGSRSNKRPDVSTPERYVISSICGAERAALGYQ